MIEENQNVAAGLSAVRTIAITSGKGGVGKTNIATNIAILMRKYKKKILLIDLDLGLANVDILLGIHPEYTLQDVIEGRKEVKEIIVEGPEGIRIVPASSGIEGLANLNNDQKEQLYKSFSGLDEEVDIMLVDTGAGISSDVLNFVLASNEILLITTPEPTAITDAYAMIKVLSRKRKNATIKLFVNHSDSKEEADSTMKKIALVSQRFLDVKLEYAGYMLHDQNVSIATRMQKPFTTVYPSTKAASCLNKLVATLLKNSDSAQSLGVGDYFRRITNSSTLNE
ncbi:MAG: MinD/ParA family protein [Candidatus Kuenenia sp.]|nr:MinD/ParA family protein [Candidatus Kuenenia hertensis]